MERKPVLYSALNFGAMSGLASFAFILILFYAGFNPLGRISWLGFWIPLVFMVWCTKNYRDNELGGYINYGTAFQSLFLTASLSAILFCLLLYIFGTVVKPEIVERFRSDSIQYLEESASMTKSVFGEGIYDESIKSIEASTIKTIAYQEFFNKTFGGLFYALITAAFLKRKPQQNQL